MSMVKWLKLAAEQLVGLCHDQVASLCLLETVSTHRKWEKQVPAGRILFRFLSPCGNRSRCCATHLVLVARIEIERRAVLLWRSADDISMLSLKKHSGQKRHCQVVTVVVSFLHSVMGRLAAVCVDFSLSFFQC